MNDIRTMDANGLRFAYIEEGEGPLVLLCHGFPDTAHTWDDLRPRLAEAGYRAVSPFMRGYAPTAVPDDKVDALTLGHDLIAWVEALGEERAVVVGHDWGALATYAATSLAPERFERAFVVDVPHPNAQKPSLSLLWHVRHFFLFNLPGAAERFRANDFAYMETLCRRWSPTWDLNAADLAPVKESLAPPGATEAAVGYYHMLRTGKPDPVFRTKIAVPTTAVACTDHPELSAEMFEAARRYYDADYEVATIPGGHFAHREHPDAFADLVISRLARAAK